MPRTYFMSWVPARRGWMKWYKGHNFSVSCRQLDAEPTKEASWQAANDWWEEKVAELRQQAAVPPLTIDPASQGIKNLLDRFSIKDLRRLAGRGEAAQKVLDILEKASVAAAIAPLQPGIAPLPCATVTVTNLESGTGIPSQVLSEIISNGFSKDLSPEWQRQHVQSLDRQIGVEAVPKDRKVKGQVDAWVRNQHSRHVAGKISAGRYDAYDRNVGVFVEWIRPGTDISEITAHRLRDYYDWLCQQIGAGRFSPAYSRSLFNATKNFVSRIAELGLIPLPGNIRSRDFSFDDSPQEIEYFTRTEIRSLCAECDKTSPRTKLFLLLMLNCGMYQSDIADLKPSEVDLERGVITRRRSKRRKQGLKVTYKLWPETMELLRTFGSFEGELVLTSEEGNPLVSYRVPEGGFERYDLIGHAYNIIRKRAGVAKSIKVFRKTSANTLDQHRVYRSFCPYFLAHAPRTVTEISYVGTPPEELFFEAIDWLREELFLRD
jgi:integrase